MARRPATLYSLGRSYFANAGYGKAVATLERYAAAQAAAGRPLLPASAGGVPSRNRLVATHGVRAQGAAQDR